MLLKERPLVLTRALCQNASMQVSSREGLGVGLERGAQSDLLELLRDIEGENRLAVERFLDDADNYDRVMTASGSRRAHHAWRGGYAEHIRQAMILIKHNYKLIQELGVLESLPEEEKFTLSDALTVIFLHDIEKPFIYQCKGEGAITILMSMTKLEREEFRRKIIKNYGFEITPTMDNALLHVEGARDENYVPGERADHPLAALCHTADHMSARMMHSFKLDL